MIARRKTVPLGTLGTPWSSLEAFVLLRRFLLLFIPKNKITAERKLRFLSKTGVRNGKYRNPEDSGRNMQPSKRALITLNIDAKSALHDTCTLIHQLGKRPTHGNEFIPDPQSHAAYHDAAAEGAGGVWFSLTGQDATSGVENGIPTGYCK